MTLLDTDILTLLMHGHARIAECFARSDAIGITIVTRIEVLQGRFDFLLKAANSAELLRAQEWLSDNEAYIDGIDVVPFDQEAAEQFDKLRQDAKLKKIGRADLLIACIALANGATLVTRNLKPLRLVPGLKLENWAD